VAERQEENQLCLAESKLLSYNGSEQEGR